MKPALKTLKSNVVTFPNSGMQIAAKLQAKERVDLNVFLLGGLIDPVLAHLPGEGYAIIEGHNDLNQIRWVLTPQL